MTVTNPLNDEREGRYREMQLPVLELDLRAFSGRVTRDQLSDLVLTDVRFKRWAYHPRQVAEQKRLLEEYDSEVGRYLQSSLDALVTEAKDLALEWYDSGYAEHLRAPLVRVFEHIEARGFYGAASQEFYGHHAIVPRLLSIALGRPVGYEYSSVFEVINALAARNNDDQRWSTLYLIAIKRFVPLMSAKHQAWVAKWRQDIWERVRSGDPRVERPSLFDRTIAAFFPELEAPLSKSAKNATTHSRQGSARESSTEVDAHRSRRSGSVDNRGNWAAIIEGKPYSSEELHEYLLRKRLAKRHKP